MDFDTINHSEEDFIQNHDISGMISAIPLQKNDVSERSNEDFPVSFEINQAIATAMLCTDVCLDLLKELVGYLDRSKPDINAIFVRTERMITISQVAYRSHKFVAKLGSTNKPQIQQLNEQKISSEEYKLKSSHVGFLAEDTSTTKPDHSNAQFLRRIIRQRQSRSRFFDNNLFSDPAWDMLLDLFAATSENRRVSVTSLCIASGVPPTTALRWIGQMVEVGLLERNDDVADRRRAFISLSNKAINSLGEYFKYIGKVENCII